MMNTKKLKKVAAKTVAQAKDLEKKYEKVALKEYAKVKKQMEVTSKKVEKYIKENPEKAAAISAAVGIALGAVAGAIAAKGKKRR